MTIDFTGKTVLVTGATRGIGRQIADDLLNLGARLILTGTKQQQIDALNAEADDRATYHCADFSRRESLDAIICDIDGCLSPELPRPSATDLLARISDHNRRARETGDVPPLTPWSVRLGTEGVDG